MLIGFSGRAGSGKDTLADILVSRINSTPYLLKNGTEGIAKKVSFASPLKKACSEIFTDLNFYDGDREKVDNFWKWSPRKILQYVGTDLLRQHIGDDIWVKHLLKNYVNEWAQSPCIHIISDVRFENEAQMITGLGGLLFSVHRDEAQLTCSKEHVSENFPWIDDYVTPGCKLDNNFEVDDLANVFQTHLVLISEKIKLMQNDENYKPKLDNYFN